MVPTRYLCGDDMHATVAAAMDDGATEALEEALDY